MVRLSLSGTVLLDKFKKTMVWVSWLDLLATKLVMHVLIETLTWLSLWIGCHSNSPPIVFNKKLKEIGGIELEPWLTRPFCDALRKHKDPGYNLSITIDGEGELFWSTWHFFVSSEKICLLFCHGKPCKQLADEWRFNASLNTVA